MAAPAAILLALGLAFPRLAAVRVLRADAPPLLAGDRLLVERRATRRRPPRRGELVVTDGPPGLGRVLAVAGETVALRPGAVRLDGRALPRWRIADGAGGRARARVAFPDGRLLDLPETADLPATTVPAGRLLLLDADGGARLVPAPAVAGRAAVVLLSVPPGARLRAPLAWARAVRWERSGLRP